jgi:hypothetical protein
MMRRGLDPVNGALGRAAALACLALLWFWGCAAGGASGRLIFDHEVTRMFTGHAVPSDYRYYYTGRSSMPYAIVGIVPEYELATRWWEPVSPNTKDFESKVDFIWDPHVWYQVEPPQGSWILAPDGKKIGIWYSRYASAPIRVTDQRIEIYSPDLEE